MELKGGCRCGAVRFEVRGDPAHVALCHCEDCRRSAGAPAVAWGAFPEGAFTLLEGTMKAYASSPSVERSFCPECGTGLTYRNPEVLPGLVDIQVAALDNPEALAPQAHIQTAERLAWMKDADRLPEFERYPSPEE